jgi:hypothetical protein
MGAMFVSGGGFECSVVDFCCAVIGDLGVNKGILRYI